MTRSTALGMLKVGNTGEEILKILDVIVSDIEQENIVENDTKDNIAEENIDEKDDDGIVYDLSKLTILYYFLIIYLFSMTLMTS